MLEPTLGELIGWSQADCSEHGKNEKKMVDMLR
jgi:hypothetical protein